MISLITNTVITNLLKI